MQPVTRVVTTSKDQSVVDVEDQTDTYQISEQVLGSFIPHQKHLNYSYNSLVEARDHN